MKRIASALLALILLIALVPMPVQAASSPRTTTVCRNTALYQSKNVKSKTLRTIHRGDTVKLISQSGSWAKLQVGKQTGYAKKDNVYLNPIRSGQVRMETMLKKQGKSGGANYQRMKVGKKVKVLGNHGRDWLTVWVDGKVGYALRKKVHVNGAKTVYLTFDDGPSSLTPSILKVLRQKNVKASFFVVGTQLNSSSNRTYLKQIHRDGHEIALHSETHNYSKIYASTSAYMNDLTKVRNRVRSLTGVSSKMVRFPGGSNNANRGHGAAIRKELRRQGYQYADWTVDTEDWRGRSASALYSAAVTPAKKQAMPIILMHDMGKNHSMVNALPRIIDALYNAGYQFDTISNRGSWPHFA